MKVDTGSGGTGVEDERRDVFWVTLGHSFPARGNNCITKKTNQMEWFKKEGKEESETVSFNSIFLPSLFRL